MPELENSIIWLGAIAGALTSIVALLSLAFRPFLKLKERITEIEKQHEELRSMIQENSNKLASDHHSFEIQQKMNKLLLESTSNLLKHNVDGNHSRQMMDCARRIDELVFARGSSIKEDKL